MRLVFIGADHEVTGSCHFMEVGGKNFCVDIGMEQGQDLFENQELRGAVRNRFYVTDACAY